MVWLLERVYLNNINIYIYILKQTYSKHYCALNKMKEMEEKIEEEARNFFFVFKNNAEMIWENEDLTKDMYSV